MHLHPKKEAANKESNNKHFIWQQQKLGGECIKMGWLTLKDLSSLQKDEQPNFCCKCSQQRDQQKST